MGSNIATNSALIEDLANSRVQSCAKAESPSSNILQSLLRGTSQGLSAIVVLSEMDNAPWWKFAGYIACILFMMVPRLLITLAYFGRGTLRD